MSPQPHHADTFLRFACWDQFVHGISDHRMYDAAAQRLLRLHPEIAHHSVYTAVVCGDLHEVRRRLADDPEAGTRAGGPRDWTPMLYLAFTRFTHQPSIDNAVAIGQALLDAGANPNDSYPAGGVPYSALTGAAGGGEQDCPRQPQSVALFELLLARGAEPFDTQVLYNTFLHNDLLWWLELVYARTARDERAAAWSDPSWAMFDMGGYGNGARFILDVAIRRKNVDLARWALAHGADPNAAPARDPRWSKRSLFEDAIVNEQTAIADLLRAHGAIETPITLTDQELFLAACRHGRFDEAATLAERHPAFVAGHHALFGAAAHNAVPAVRWLLDLGTPAGIEDSREKTALHEAAANGALAAMQLLIDRGAPIDAIERTYGNAPIGWASHFGRRDAMDLLAPVSKHVWTLAFEGYVDRLREVLATEPGRAREVRPDDGMTPLWWLPIDEDRALTVAQLLLAAGADRSIKNHHGHTAADWATKLGMPKVAAILR